MALQRFNEAKKENKPETELLQHLDDALRHYQQAIDMAPSDAVQQLAPLHNALGGIRGNAGNLVRALNHYREAIRYTELAGDVYNAANIRYNVANDLACAGRFPDAWEYALAALRNFQTYGASAQQEIQKTLDLIADIDKAAGAG